LPVRNIQSECSWINAVIAYLLKTYVGHIFMFTAM